MAPPPAYTHELDQEMVEHIASPPHLQNRAQQGIPPLPNHESTPRTRLNFEITDPAKTPADGKITSDNPFVEASEDAHRTDLLQKLHEDLSEGWTFQGRKKLPVRIVSSRQDPTQPVSRTSQSTLTPGGKRGQMHSKLHHTYFESLGIPVPVG